MGILYKPLLSTTVFYLVLVHRLFGQKIYDKVEILGQVNL